jgi:hypothetical protein
MRQLHVLSAILALGAALPALAAEPCSIHPPKGASDAQLKGLAKVSQAQAEKIAVAKLRGDAAVTVASAELEAEHQCLIWSFDLQVAGKSGVQEVQVDAGDGRVLSVKHESASKEASEAANEKGVTPRK